MSCIICLSTSADAGHACTCSARICPACLLAQLDRGLNRCVVCGSNFEPLAVVRACLHNLQNCGVSSGELAKAHGKLAVAYSIAGRPRQALRSLAIAHLHAEPNSRWEQFLKLESAQNLLCIGETTEADRVSRNVMPTALRVPTSKPEAALYAHCCLVKCKINVQRDKQGPAASWLRRAIGVQSDFGLDAPLATSLQLHAELLSKEGKHHEAKQALERAEGLMLNYETDAVLRARVAVDLAKTEVRLGQFDSARTRLSGVLPMLRKRKRDRDSAGLLQNAARALSDITSPVRRLRRKTLPEKVECRVES